MPGIIAMPGQSQEEPSALVIIMFTIIQITLVT